MPESTIAGQLATHEFDEWDLNPQLIRNVVTDSSAFVGAWQLVKERSESHDQLLAALGIPMFKRAIVKHATTSTTFHEQADDGRPFVYMVSHLPMGKVKEGKVYVDGEPFDYKDRDTGEWVTCCCIVDGRMLQKRVHKNGKGIMFDIRAVFDKDPEGILSDEEGPFQCFKWGYQDAKGQKYVAHRWFKRLH